MRSQAGCICTGNCRQRLEWSDPATRMLTSSNVRWTNSHWTGTGITGGRASGSRLEEVVRRIWYDSGAREILVHLHAVHERSILPRMESRLTASVPPPRLQTVSFDTRLPIDYLHPINGNILIRPASETLHDRLKIFVQCGSRCCIE